MPSQWCKRLQPNLVVKKHIELVHSSELNKENTVFYYDISIQIIKVQEK